MTETVTPDLRTTTQRTIAASPEAIYNAWLDAEKLARFMRPGPDMTVPHAKTSAQEGGCFDILMKVGDQEIPHSGTYLTLTPHSKIVFTWESPFSTEGSTVTIDMAPAGSGTEVALTHIRFPSEESRDNHAAGWARILETLDGELA